MQTREAKEQRMWAIKKLHNSVGKGRVINVDKGDRGAENVGHSKIT